MDTRADLQQTRYALAPYESHACLHSHPASLAAMAQLLGLSPAPVANCRVLELGSGTGSNLLPMAEDLPGAELIGLDLSAPQVEISRALAAALGLRNVSFRQMDVMDVTAEMGRFDYIIAHGLYSWVPEVVRERILGLCRENLAPGGLAYISFNTLPGWHFPLMLREFFRFHARDVGEDPEARVQAVDQALLLLRDGIGPKSQSTAKVLQAYARQYAEHLESLGSMRGSSLHHDILAEVNEPMYFRDFAAAAERHGLQFVTEAPPELSGFSELPQGVKEALIGSAGSVVEMEQYLDFLQMRMFRQSVLCHAEVEVDRVISISRMVGLHIGTRVRPAAARPDLETSLLERFVGPAESVVTINHPLSKAALCVLSEAQPRAIEFSALVLQARSRLGQPPQAGDAEGTSEDAQELGRLLFRMACQRREMMRLRASAPRAIGLLERAGAAVGRLSARAQAAGSAKVTNCYHETVTLEPMMRWALQRLDGRRDRAALLDELCTLAAEGKIKLPQEGFSVRSPSEVRAALDADLGACLNGLSEESLLV